MHASLLQQGCKSNFHFFPGPQSLMLYNILCNHAVKLLLMQLNTARTSLPLCLVVLSFPKPNLLLYSQLDAFFKKLCIVISQCFLISVCGSSSVIFSRDASRLHRSSQEPGSCPQDVGIVPLEAIPQRMTNNKTNNNTGVPAGCSCQVPNRFALTLA